MRKPVEPAAVSIGRLAVGGAVFVASFLSPALVPWVASSPLATEWKAGLSGLLLFGIPELAIFVAVLILGKPGYEYLRHRLWGLVRRFAPADRVGPVRYRVGLVLFVLPILLGWLAPYVADRLPRYTTHSVVYAVAGDALLLVSLFVLGGEFWAKLGALFVQGATVAFPLKRANRVW